MTIVPQPTTRRSPMMGGAKSIPPATASISVVASARISRFRASFSKVVSISSIVEALIK